MRPIGLTRSHGHAACQRPSLRVLNGILKNSGREIYLAPRKFLYGKPTVGSRKKLIVELVGWVDWQEVGLFTEHLVPES